jgi:hypothetical protein
MFLKLLYVFGTVPNIERIYYNRITLYCKNFLEQPCKTILFMLFFPNFRCNGHGTPQMFPRPMLGGSLPSNHYRNTGCAAQQTGAQEPHQP